MTAALLAAISAGCIVLTSLAIADTFHSVRM
jgi:hypothetical protein